MSQKENRNRQRNIQGVREEEGERKKMDLRALLEIALCLVSEATLVIG